MKCMSELPEFQFHRMIRKVKFTHLVFADDLMIFCKWDVPSVSRIMALLQHFSSVTGLVENMDKSNIFMAGWMTTLKANCCQE